jgi:predicted secreted protein
MEEALEKEVLELAELWCKCTGNGSFELWSLRKVSSGEMSATASHNRLYGGFTSQYATFRCIVQCNANSFLD